MAALIIGFYSSEDLVARAVVVVGVWCLSGDVEGEVISFVMSD